MKISNKMILMVLAAAIVLAPSALSAGFEQTVHDMMVSPDKSCYVYTKNSILVNDGAQLNRMFSAEEKYKIYPLHDAVTLNSLLTRNRVSFEKKAIGSKEIIFIVDHGKAKKTGKEAKADKNSREAQVCYQSLPYLRGYNSDSKPAKAHKDSAQNDYKLALEMVSLKRPADLRFDKNGDGLVTMIDIAKMRDALK